MSRILADLLGAAELPFRTRIGQLENASGAPAADVRLTAEIIQLGQAKLRQLDLDKSDTKAPELYAALNQRYIRDDQYLTRTLRRERPSEQTNIMSDVSYILSKVDLPKQCMSIRPAVAKNLLKELTPKNTMKLLGYRSLDSMLKHEVPAAVLAVAQFVESATWQKQLRRQIGHLGATDFELKPMAITYEKTERWQKVAEHPAIHKKHHAVPMPLSASLLMLPYGKDVPPATLLTTLVISVRSINHLVAASSFLKLHQMRPDFSEVLQSVIEDDSLTMLSLLDEPISWHLIHRYYNRFANYYRTEIFEPYLRPDDFCRLTLDAVVGDLLPDASFWSRTDSLGMLDGKEVVSYNLHDVAVNACNDLPFEKRVSHSLRQSLWHELLLGYMKIEKVEQAVAARMQPELNENNS